MVYKKKKNNQKNQKSSEPKDSTWDTSFKTIARENTAFNNYYKKQGILSEEEWNKFIGSLQSDLPAAFRVVPTAGLWRPIQKYFQDVSERSDAWLSPLDFYPEGLGFQFHELDRHTIRKQKDLNAATQHSKKLLQLETQRGGVQRQETVSMIPPLLLRANAGHSVLDMCAAPGSKTSQIIDLMHSAGRQSSEGSLLPGMRIDPLRGEGIVVANEVDARRAGILAHNLTRLPSATVAVTIQDAGNLPMLRTNLKELNKKDRLVAASAPLFDRILADVPCSGDGTLRKNQDIWTKWALSGGMGLHLKQLQILKRGWQLLKPGGRLVYSTCSFNPLENEAVVAAFLQDTSDACLVREELISLSQGANSFKIRNGVSTWSVVDPRDETCSTYLTCIPPKPAKKPKKDQQAEGNNDQMDIAIVDKFQNEEEDEDEEEDEEEQTNVENDDSTTTPAPTDAPKQSEGVDVVAPPKSYRRNPLHMLRETMFETYADERIRVVELPKCMRVFPHDNNSGGFFIAVFDKPGDEAVDPTSPSSANHAESSGEDVAPPSKRVRHQEEGEELIIETEEVAEEDMIWDEGRDAPQNQNMEAASLRLGSIPASTYDKLNAFFDLSTSGSEPTGLGLLPPSLPLSRSCLLTRDANAKRVYITSKQGAGLNARLLNAGVDMKWVALGSRCFQRFASLAKSETTKAESTWRLCQDGVRALLPYMGRRVVVASRKFAVDILSNGLFDLTSEEGREVFMSECSGWKTLCVDGSTFESGIITGGIAIVVADLPENRNLDKYEGNIQKACDQELVIAGVMGVKKIEVYVTKQDRLALLQEINFDSSINNFPVATDVPVAEE